VLAYRVKAVKVRVSVSVIMRYMAIGKMQMCRPSTGKMRTILADQVAFYPCAVVTNEVRFLVYKPVGYTCNSSLINVSWEHTQWVSQISAVRCGNMALPKRLCR